MNKYKNTIIALVVIVLLFVAYTKFEPQNNLSFLTKVDSGQSATILGNDIINAINQINNLDLDRSVFDDPIFKNLVDRSEEINPEPRGRSNPFLPIGVGARPVSSATSTRN